jgi:hypothetical protein
MPSHKWDAGETASGGSEICTTIVCIVRNIFSSHFVYTSAARASLWGCENENPAVAAAGRATRNLSGR